MARHVGPGAVTLILAALWSSLALAQAPAATERRAAELYDQSEVAYREGRFGEAADLLRETYALRPMPVLLYNLGRVLEGAGDLPGAIDAYGRYLHEDPRTLDRPSIEQRLRTLRAQVEATERHREAEARAQAEAQALRRAVALRPPVEPRGAQLVPWLVAGVGAATAAVGAGFAFVALDRHQRAIAEPVNATAQGLQTEGQSLATVANVLFAAGGALAATGGTWLLLRASVDRGRPERRPERAAVRATLLPGLSSLSVEVRF